MSTVAKRAEQIVLGAVLRCPTMLDELTAVLRAEDFAWSHHGLIYRTFQDLAAAGTAISLEVLADDLHRRGLVEDVGGYAALKDLWEATATGGDALHFAARVRSRALIRRLNAAAGEVLSATSAGDGDAAALLEQAERSILAVGESGLGGDAVSAGEAVEEVFDRIDDRATRGGGLSGLATGFLDLDERTAGLQSSELCVLAARPSVGKTALAIGIVRHVAITLGLPVYFASLEQSRHELIERLLCSIARVDSHRLRKGTLTDYDSGRLLEARGPVKRAPLFIADQAHQTVAQIAAGARRQKRKHGVRLVVVDYLQLIAPEDRRAPRHEQVGAISRRLKGLARELRVPVLALCQLSRAAEEGDRPRLSHLRESGDIEANADLCLLMHRPATSPGTVEVIVAKNRNGPVGEVTLAFEARYTTFANYAAATVPFSDAV